MKKYKTVESVKEKLGSNDLSILDEKDTKRLITLTPEMEDGIRTQIFENLPLNSQTMGFIIKHCVTQLSKVNTSHNHVMAAYKKAVDSITELISKDNITEEDRKYYSQQLEKYLSIMATKDRNFKISSMVGIGIVAFYLGKLVYKALINKRL